MGPTTRPRTTPDARALTQLVPAGENLVVGNGHVDFHLIVGHGNLEQIMRAFSPEWNSLYLTRSERNEFWEKYASRRKSEFDPITLIVIKEDDGEFVVETSELSAGAWIHRLTNFHSCPDWLNMGGNVQIVIPNLVPTGTHGSHIH